MKGRRPTFTPSQARAIRKAREEYGLSLRQLQERFGSAVPTLGDIVYERGAYHPDVMEIRDQMESNDTEIQNLKTINAHLAEKLKDYRYKA